MYKKSKHFAKGKKICVMFLYTNIQTFCVMQFFIEFLKLAEGGGTFLFSKNNALCVIFLCPKNISLCVTFLYTKIRTFFVTRFFIEFLKLAEGGGDYIQKLCTLRYVFNTKSLTLCFTFLYAKNDALCVTFLYLKFIE